MKKTIYGVCLALLLLENCFMLSSLVYAESNISHEEEPQVENSPSEFDVEEEDEESEIEFSFEQASMQTIVDQPITVTFFSDKKAVDVPFTLPSEATVVETKLKTGTSVVQVDSHKWIMRTQNEQNTFEVPIIFHSSGTYAMTIGEKNQAMIVVQEKELSEETVIDESSDVTEIDGSSESSENQTTISEIDTTGNTVTKNGLERSNSSQLVNPFLSYEETDQSILGWTMRLGRKTKYSPYTFDLIGISNIFDETQQFRYGLTSIGRLDRDFAFRIDSHNDGLIGKLLRENSVLVVSQNFQTTPGKKYLLREKYTTDRQHSLMVFLGTEFYGSDEIGDIDVAPGVKESLFTATNDNYTVSSFTFSDESQAYSEISIHSIELYERIELEIEYLDTDGNKIYEDSLFYGGKGEEYEIDALDIPGYILKSSVETGKGILEEDATITFQYFKEDIVLADPLDPEEEVNPENQPELPEDQGLLSIDFISAFNFGVQKISVKDQTYYAKTQRLLNEDGTINETKERPNYIQLSDRRSDNIRNGWQLAVTQKEQFSNQSGQELIGARLSLTNQQVITSQGGQPPTLQAVSSELIPGNKRLLLNSEGSEGWGTWIYRFGDASTAGESIKLEVPKDANPEATTYSSTFVWELSAVPDN